MVVCKYFLQGNCRYGENCKFEHQINDGRLQHSSVLRQQNFTANPSNSQPAGNTNIDTNTLIRAVVNDMTVAEKGGQWLLSCYAPFKEKPNFPGFEEQSFEEVRWGYYEAQRTGTVDLFKQQLQITLQGAVARLKALQNPSREAICTITNIYNSIPLGSSPNVFGNTFNNNQATGGFSTAQNSIFGNSTGATNIFGQTNNFAGANMYNQQQIATTKSIFASANQELFGNTQPQQNSIFGGNFNTANSFVHPFSNQNNHQQNPVFSNQQLGTPSLFNPQSGMFNVQSQSFQAQQPPLFNSQQTNTPLFTGPAPSFGIQQPAQVNSPMFVTTTQQQQPQPSNMFRVANEPSQAAVPFNNAYGNALQQTAPAATATLPPYTNIFNPNMSGSSNDTVYSKLEDLTENEIKSFESETFEFGKIPEKPPTMNMCFYAVCSYSHDNDRNN